MGDDKDKIVTGDGDEINVSKEKPGQVQSDRDGVKKHGPGIQPESDRGADPSPPSE